MDSSETIILQIYFTIIFLISILASIALIYSYFILPKRSFGLHMIVILSILGIIFYIGQIMYTWQEDGPIGEAGAIISDFFGIFWILWTTVIAFYFYKSVRFNPPNPARYIMWSMVILGCLSAAIALP